MKGDLEKKLLKNLAEAKKFLETNKKQSSEKLEKLAIDIREGFDQRIERLSRRRDLVAEAFRDRVKMKQWRVGIIRSIFQSKPWTLIKFLISVPFIYGVFIPAVIFHIFVELYHQVAFRLYGIPLVKAKDYFVFDRVLLSYLNKIEKINCLYCSYFNCLVAYAGEIGGRTERFWCPIKHARKVKGSHSQYSKFVDYLGAEEFRRKKHALREFTKDEFEE